MLFDNQKLSRKIGLMIGLAVVSLVAASAASLDMSYHRMIKDRVSKVQAAVDIAVTLATSLEEQVRSGTLTRLQALGRFRETLNNERFDGNNYVFAFDYGGVAVVKPDNQAGVGQSRIGDTDSRGFHHIQAIVDAARLSGGGHVVYHTPHLGSKVPESKMAVVRAFAPWNLAIGAGIYMDDVRRAMWGLAAELALITGPLLLVLCGVGLLTYHSVVGGLSRLAVAMGGLAAGDIQQEVPETGRRDEVGVMARAVEVFKQGLAKAHELATEREAEEARKLAQVERVAKLSRDFEAHAGKLFGSLSANAGELQQTATLMTSTASETHVQAGEVATSAVQASANVQSVASAAEQLAASISEISRQVLQCSGIAERAAGDARRTDAVVRALSEGAQKIGEVVNLIANIAGQTNLLALNATIEAARAGDAGKGFAVVASEVKNLAAQTARATEEIGGQITQVQRTTQEAVEAITGIGGVIEEMQRISSSVAAAVEEQGTATREISRNVQEAATGTDTVTRTIAEVNAAATRTGEASDAVLRIAAEVSGDAARLNEGFELFVSGVRAA